MYPRNFIPLFVVLSVMLLIVFGALAYQSNPPADSVVPQTANAATPSSPDPLITTGPSAPY